MNYDEDSLWAKTFVIIDPPDERVFRMMHKSRFSQWDEKWENFAEARYPIESIPFIEDIVDDVVYYSKDGETPCYLNIYSDGSGHYRAVLEIQIEKHMDYLQTWGTVLEMGSNEKGCDLFVQGTGIEEAINEHRLGLL